MRRIAGFFCFAVLVQAQQPGLHAFLTGDSIVNRRLSVYNDPAYLAMFERIRKAGVGFTNFETLIHTYQFAGASVSGGAYMGSAPWIVDELKWAGFNLLSTANNHAFDYGPEGMLNTIHALDAAGLTHAGTGENLALARAPAYLDTAYGRVALVACASTFTPGSLAGEQRPDLKGRPGVSPLRFTTAYTVDAGAMDGLRKLALLMGPGGAAAGTARIGGLTFREGKSAAIETEPMKEDLDGVAASIRDGRRQADWVVVSIHAHEGKPGNREEPADFLVTFAHAAIDAGADVVAAHGPHVLRPIEIYKGKPIFYSLANFVFENETMEFQPAESYKELGLPATAVTADFYDARSRNDTRGFPVDRPMWESAIAEVSFAPDRKLKEIRLHPITLGFGEPRPQRGRPRPASPEMAKQIIDHLAALSAPFGTKIEFADGQGVAGRP